MCDDDITNQGSPLSSTTRSGTPSKRDVDQNGKVISVDHQSQKTVSTAKPGNAATSAAVVPPVPGSVIPPAPPVF